MEILTSPQQYAKLLDTPEELANFNMQYLIDRGLVRGKALGSLGTTKKDSFVHDLTSFGVEAVEGQAERQDLAVNFSIINVNAPVTASQIAIGGKINQTYLGSIRTFDDLHRYLDQNFEPGQIEALKTQLRELEEQIKAESVKPGTLSKIKDTVQNLGPAATIVMEVIQKILSLTSK